MTAEIVRTEVDGVPVYWAKEDGPLKCALVFRVGKADETLTTNGITHLVEHLACFSADIARSQYGAQVDPTHTLFHAYGEPGEVTAFLRSVCDSLAALPLDRIELEKRVLRTEQNGKSVGGLANLLQLRFGAAGHGLVWYDELGLRRIGEDDVARWALERFTRENAALWLTGPPPEGLALPLPRGRRMPEPALRPIPGLQTPAYAHATQGEVAVSFLGARSSALVAGLKILEDSIFQRLRLDAGLTYSVGCGYWPLTAEDVHVVVGADCRDQDAHIVRDGILTALEEMSQHGPSEDVLGQYRSMAAAEVERRGAGNLHYAVLNELAGRQSKAPRALAREIEELSPTDIADAIRALFGSAIMVAPSRTEVPKGYVSYGFAKGEPVVGERERLRGVSRKRARLIASPDGLSWLPAADGSGGATVRYADVAALIKDGPNRVTLIANTGESIGLRLPAFAREEELRAQIGASVPAHLTVEIDDPPALPRLIEDKLEGSFGVQAELEALADWLREDEFVVNLGRAERGLERGLAALTNQRLLYLCASVTTHKIATRIEIPLDEITKVDRLWPKLSSQSVDIRTPTRRVWFRSLKPAARTAEFREALQAAARREAA